MNTKEVIKQVTDRYRVDAELGLEVFETVDREFKNGKGWCMANWYIIYDTLQGADKELSKKEKIDFAETCYDIYLRSDNLGVRILALAVVNLLNDEEEKEITSCAIEARALDISMY